MDFETRAIHDGPGTRSDDRRDDDADLRDVDLRAGGGRLAQGLRLLAHRNPTRTALQPCLASLESAEHGVAFASGLGATTTLMHLLNPGDRIVLIADVYGGVYRMTSQVYEPKGYVFEYVPAHEFAEPRRAPRRADAHGLGRDAVEPAAEHRRHPRGRRRRPRGRRAARRRQHVRVAVPAAAARARRRRCRSTRRRSTSAATPTSSAASSRRTTRRSRSGSSSCRSRSAPCPGPFDSWLVLRGIKTLACACAGTARTRVSSPRSSRSTTRSRRSSIPALRSIRATRSRGGRWPTSAAWSRSSRVGAGSGRPRGADEDLEARRVARRRGVDDRGADADDARVDRRRAVRGAAEPRASLRRDRVRRRPRRGSRTGARAFSCCTCVTTGSPSRPHRTRGERRFVRHRRRARARAGGRPRRQVDEPRRGARDAVAARASASGSSSPSP